VKSRHLSKVIIVLCALASGCAGETVATPRPARIHWQAPGSTAPSPVVPTERERALAQAYAAAIASPHFAALGALLDDDARFVCGARNTRGRERVVKQYDDLLGAFDDRRFVASRTWLTDSTQTLNTQAMEWTMTGLQARAWQGVPPTGKPVTIKGLMLLWATDDGIITEVHVYFDEDVIKGQLGAGPLDLRGLPTPAAPGGPSKVLERTGSAAAEKANVATFRAMLQALEDGHEPAFLATMTEDVGVFTLDDAEPLRGRDAARSYFKNVRRGVRQVDTVVENAWGVGSFVIVEYSITGLQIAPLPRIPLAGSEGLHPLHTQFVDIAEIQDGKIAQIWRYCDPISFASL
jgi:steroid delta-isomerase-like uncharacterized protein